MKSKPRPWRKFTACKITSCRYEVSCKGLCSMHYQRKRLGHDMSAPRKGTIATEDRFWSKVDKSGDCWLWTAGKDKKGYGRFKLRGVTPAAHRVAWQITNGPIPEGMLVCHSCDNPGCCRPDHLWLGTNLDNLTDMAVKGRKAILRGEASPSAKLCELDVWLIRNVNSTHKKMAEFLGVSYAIISLIRGRKNWKHV